MERYLPVYFLLLSIQWASAQTTSVSTNAGDLLCLGTLNIRAAQGLNRNWTVQADARWNPWTFSGDDAENQYQLRHQTYALGVRFWPWYIYSGFFLGSKIQYQEYNRGGLSEKLPTEEGDAWGLGLEAGYAVMLTRRFNLEIGMGGWGGFTHYKTYSCPRCGKVTGSGAKWFLFPNELILSFVVVL